jgi:hypothetical protein
MSGWPKIITTEEGWPENAKFKFNQRIVLGKTSKEPDGTMGVITAITSDPSGTYAYAITLEEGPFLDEDDNSIYVLEKGLEPVPDPPDRDITIISNGPPSYHGSSYMLKDPAPAAAAAAAGAARLARLGLGGGPSMSEGGYRRKSRKSRRGRKTTRRRRHRRRG